jgi:hypothetical protein
MLAVTDVHLTGGKPLWQELAGPVLLAATAIVAAWIAANTANQRQAAQLANDRELQKAQLAYDREQRNRQHVRDTIDSAVRSVDAAMRQAMQHEALVLIGDEKRDESRRILNDESVSSADREAALRRYEEAMDEVATAIQKGFEASSELTSGSFRLSLRLGPDHPICQSHDDYVAAYAVCFETLRDLPAVKLSDDDEKGIKAAADIADNAMMEFLSSCREWFAGEQREVAQQEA